MGQIIIIVVAVVVVVVVVLVVAAAAATTVVVVVVVVIVIVYMFCVGLTPARRHWCSISVQILFKIKWMVRVIPGVDAFVPVVVKAS